MLADDERDRFIHAAKSEGVSLSEWLRLAARDRLRREREQGRFRRAAELAAFFEGLDDRADPGEEPDWETHKQTIESSRGTGYTET